MFFGGFESISQTQMAMPQIYFCCIDHLFIYLCHILDVFA